MPIVLETIGPPTDWTMEAGCRFRDPADYYAENLPADPVEAQRVAGQLCEGCPVVRECYQRALSEFDVGRFLDGEPDRVPVTGVVMAGEIW